MGREMQIPTRDIMRSTLERAVPGPSQVVRQMREQLLDFASSITSRTVLLKGPIGAGKSTIARFIGLLKRVAPLTVVEASRILSDVRYDGSNRIDLRYIPWYVELTLTGLVESLVEVQLFGSTKGAYTGSTQQRAGVFEHASTGRSSKGREHDASLLTGGVVFLDEIGDITPAIQAKLLPVLSGAAFYRIGGEGDTSHELQFRGVTITASWRRLDGGLLRPDLLSRVSTYTIVIPGLGEREGDFDALLDETQSSIVQTIRRSIDDAERAEPNLDRAYWRARKDSIRGLDSGVRRKLAKIDWSRHGNLRGLTAAVEQIIAAGRKPEMVIDELPIIREAEPATEHIDGILTRLIDQAGQGGGVAGHVRAIEVQQRQRLREQLMSDPSLRQKLAERLSISEQQVVAQIQQLDRRRRKATAEEA